MKRATFQSRMVILQMDVTNQKDISLAYEKVQQSLDNNNTGTKHLFALINNAGIATPHPLEWGKPDSIECYERHLNVNTLGVIRVTKTFLPLIRKSKGRIVNLTSMAARTNMFCMNHYCLSKAATSKFTEGLQEELAQFGVTAIDINPWFHKTPLLNTPQLIRNITRKFNESSEEVQKSYGSCYLEKCYKGVALVCSDPRVVIDRFENVVEALVDAVTSAEPDAVYRLASPGFGAFCWLSNDFLPWELIYLFRKLTNMSMDWINVDCQKDTIDVKGNVK